MIVVADTNILVSALNFGGVPLAFLERARSGLFTLATSQALLEELGGVLARKFGWSENGVREAVGALVTFGLCAIPEETLEVVKADPDDDRVLECAIAARADWIVSGDRDLLQLRAYRGIPIVRVAVFMERIAAT